VLDQTVKASAAGLAPLGAGNQSSVGGSGPGSPTKFLNLSKYNKYKDNATWDR